MQERSFTGKKMRLQYYDALTGSLNLEGFRRESGRLFPSRRHRNTHSGTADIKNFKYINDLFGFHTGNRILKILGVLPEGHVAGEDEAFCRISDDNFAFCGGSMNRIDSGIVLTDLRDRLASVRSIRRKNYQVELISGVYIPENPCGMDIDEMLNRANMARKSIVSPRGGQGFCFYGRTQGKKRWPG